MLHHVEIYVTDLAASVAFWAPFMSLDSDKRLHESGLPSLP